VASRDFHATATSLLKATFGLSEKNLNLDIQALLGQVDEIKGHPELMVETFASHPLLPIRLKAVELFSHSAKAARAGLTVSGTPLSDDALEDGVDDLVRLTRRSPYEALDQAVMRVVALGGALVLGADKDVADEEVRVLVQILHRWFTDDPENEIVTDRAIIDTKLPEAIEVVNKEGDNQAKVFLLSRLTDIAMADGALVDAESNVILELAQRLQVPPKAAYGIMVGAAQATGFRSDVKLNRMAEQIRRSMQLGLKNS